MNVGFASRAQIENSVADELAGSVIGNVASALDGVHFDATPRKRRGTDQQILLLGTAPKGNDGGVLQEE